MIKIRYSKDRGYADHNWLIAKHSFSFANYHDPDFMGFRSLRVINEDRIQASKGFGTHPHENMEIITYIISGQLSHKDSMGNGDTIHKGEIQTMSAGTGIQHSEFNDSLTDEVHLIQIWLEPNKNNISPSYNQQNYSNKLVNNELLLLASPDQQRGSLKINQDVYLYTGKLDAQKSIQYTLEENRFGWLQLINGELLINDHKMEAGDGCQISEENVLVISANQASEFIFFDLN
ncbi:MAG: quercetin 2,3-dioxygenase [Planctomycetota bacterium]|nr:MAG: quercetin 2,3-dioxygenase [Planctomycetota bacterium]